MNHSLCPLCVVPCAGTGSRAGTPTPKQYQPINGVPLVIHTLRALVQVSELDRIEVVVSSDDSTLIELLPAYGFDPKRVLVRACGGPTRSVSVQRALDGLLAARHSPQSWVLVHDAARCLIDPSDVRRLIAQCADSPIGGLLAKPATDTVKRVELFNGSAPRVIRSEDRKSLWLAQTPQMFRLGELSQAYAQAGDLATDEASAMEAVGHQPILVESMGPNLKVTHPQDFAWAECWLAREHRQERT